MDQTVSSQVRVLSSGPTRCMALPVYRADLNHPVTAAEHGNAASPARLDRADLTARRVGGCSTGRTEEAKAGGNAPDRPTSVWSEMAGTCVEPPSPGKANDDQRPLVDASRGGDSQEPSFNGHTSVPPSDAAIVRRVAGRPALGRPYEGLSRMKGNFHVRFLEGGGLATARLYSARIFLQQCLRR